MRTRSLVLLCNVGWVAATSCGADTVQSAAQTEQCQPSPDYTNYAMDGLLRLNELQALGTHNSYHVESSGNVMPEWSYSHPPLDVQLQREGVRQLEIDIHYNNDAGNFSVFHLPVLDSGTTCAKFVDCMRVIKCWSDAHPTHHPMMIMIEPKFEPPIDTLPQWIASLENEVLSVWPEHRIITPDSVQGLAPDVRTAVETTGWPTLGETRGRVLFMLHAEDTLRTAYTFGDQHTTGRVMFPNAREQMSLPYSAVHSFDDPLESVDDIQRSVRAGHLVRTRTDSGSTEATNNTYYRYNAAVASGAHFLSTDHPGTPSASSYGVDIPGGTPSRCNPLTAPVNCTSQEIESISTY